MKTIDSISYLEFKAKMIEVQQDILNSNTSNDRKDAQRAAKYFSKSKIKSPDNNHASR